MPHERTTLSWKRSSIPETLRRKFNELADSTTKTTPVRNARKVVLAALKDALVRGRANAEGIR